jgi:hypothetical protein
MKPEANKTESVETRHAFHIIQTIHVEHRGQGLKAGGFDDLEFKLEIIKFFFKSMTYIKFNQLHRLNLRSKLQLCFLKLYVH